MNKRQKEVQQSLLNDESEFIKRLKAIYQKASKDCEDKIRQLSARTDMENLQSIIYQKRYQEILKKQIDNALLNLQNNEYSSVNNYLINSYTNSFMGTLYDIHGQGVPLIFPIDQRQVAQAVQVDSKISNGLYTRMGEDVEKLKRDISSELSRGIANGSTWNETAVKIANGMNSPFKKAYNSAVRITRTEGHRIQSQAQMNTVKTAKSKGADVVKQWDATLDGKTRDSHKRLDGQIREIDEPFEIGGLSAMCPGDFGDPAEDCNCRCCMLQRARWALNETELKELEKRAEYFGLDKTKDFDDFKNKYLNAVENSGASGIIKSEGRNVIPINIQLFAKIPEEKFTKYALDPIKAPDKARAFKEALGYTIENYEDLIDSIQKNFDESLLKLKASDKYGDRYELVMNLKGPNGKNANVCTAWIKENADSEPRLTSAYVTKKEVTKNESH